MCAESCLINNFERAQCYVTQAQIFALISYVDNGHVKNIFLYPLFTEEVHIPVY